VKTFKQISEANSPTPSTGFVNTKLTQIDSKSKKIKSEVERAISDIDAVLSIFKREKNNSGFDRLNDVKSELETALRSIKKIPVDVDAIKRRHM
jgi:hypothetical protein